MAKKIGIWLLAFSLFIVHIVCRSVAHAEVPKTWNATYCKSGECNIAFPTKPEMIEQQMPLAEGNSKLTYEIYLSPHEDKGVFLLLIATYPVALEGGNEIAGLEGLLTGIVKHHAENKLVFADLVEFRGHPTVQFLVEGGNSYFRGSAFMAGNKLYLIAMEGLKSRVDEKAYKLFMESFKFSQN